jgi:predicted RNase H-like nuclease
MGVSVPGYAWLMACDPVLGVDACTAGWIGVAIGVEGGSASVQAYLAPDIDTLVWLARKSGDPAAIAIDIPIGLPDRSRRQADVLAKAAAGPRQSSVFLTPVRQALLAPDHATAAATNRRLVGEGISRQAFGLKRKLLEVEDWVPRSGVPVIEVHPEVSFTRLAGRPLTTRKSTWAGMYQRRALLSAAGISMDTDFGVPGASAGVDDVLDAAVAAWTARRYASGQARPLPDPPEVFSDGLPCAIWV